MGKDFKIKYDKSPYNPNYYQCKVIFNREDGVSLREITEALKTTNQEKLYKALDMNKVIQVFVDNDMLLVTLTKENYEKALRTLEKYPTVQA